VQTVSVLIRAVLCVGWHMAFRLVAVSMAMSHHRPRNPRGGRHPPSACAVRKASVKRARVPYYTQSRLSGNDQRPIQCLGIPASIVGRAVT
jgi:hypothetical protein